MPILATEYMDFKGSAYIRIPQNKLIKQHDLRLFFPGFRNMSVTYKLKLNGGDTKRRYRRFWSCGRNMAVYKVYSHIIDEDSNCATLLEDSFITGRI